MKIVVINGQNHKGTVKRGFARGKVVRKRCRLVAGNSIAKKKSLRCAICSPQVWLISPSFNIMHPLTAKGVQTNVIDCPTNSDLSLRNEMLNWIMEIVYFFFKKLWINNNILDFFYRQPSYKYITVVLV